MMPSLVLVLLGIVGLWAGALINQAIARWRFAGPLQIGPWGTSPSDCLPRRWYHYLPLVGWCLRTADSRVLGRGFWIRPFLIELTCLVGFPALFVWERQGGLVEAPFLAEITPGLAWGWYVPHVLLFSLLLIATFIDFDEKIIPDQVTVPGTLAALLLAWLIPTHDLPITEPGVPDPDRFVPLRFDYPGADPMAMVATGGRLTLERRSEQDAEPVAAYGQASGPEWIEQQEGLWSAWLLLGAWCFALMPKTIDWRYGLAPGVQFMFASMTRPPRKRKPKRKFQGQSRRMLPLTKLLLVVAAIGTVLLGAAWLQGGPRWYALFSALIGMGFGGLTVWSVRILGTYALHREAMGFGDVTLLAMIGAFLGWQPAFLVFVLAPFSAIFVAFAQLILTRSHELAFGPYLSLGAVLLVLGWSSVWNGWAGPSVFLMGSLLLWILLMALGLLYVMLFAYRWLLRG